MVLRIVGPRLRSFAALRALLIAALVRVRPILVAGVLPPGGIIRVAGAGPARVVRLCLQSCAGTLVPRYRRPARRIARRLLRCHETVGALLIERGQGIGRACTGMPGGVELRRDLTANRVRDATTALTRT